MPDQSRGYKAIPSLSEWAARPIDLRFWTETLSRLDQAREASSEEAVERSAEIVTRAAAVDTNAIENLYQTDRGFTISVATHAAGWQAAFAEKGALARSMFEAQLRLFELVLDAATKKLPVSEALLRSLHELACAPQATYKVLTEVGWQEHDLPKGSYKKHPNNPRTLDGSEHAYAPVDMVPHEMERLARELQSEEFLGTPAPVQAAYAHYGLAAIHPFADGNGRVARAVASIYLVRATSVPLLIFADQKGRYLDALAHADDGRYEAFSAFTRERSIDAMRLLISGIQKARAAPPETLQQRARSLFFATPELTHEEVDSLSEQLLHEAENTLRSVFDRLDLPQEIALTMETKTGDRREPPPGYRRLGRRGPPVLNVSVQSPPPASAGLGAEIRPLIARESHPMPIRLEVCGRRHDFDTRIEDLTPEVATVTRLGLETWAETLLVAMIEKVVEDGRRAREQSGWSSS